MKKYLVGLTAVVIAIVSFAFTAPKKVNFTDYIWYGIKTTIHKPCDVNVATLVLSDLAIDSRYNSTVAGFDQDINDVVYSPANALVPFNCDAEEELCAIGFLKPAPGTSTGFTNASGQWVPTLSTNLPSVVICRTEP